MFMGASIQNELPPKEPPKIDRRRAARRQEDRLREEAHQERARELHSLFELGQIIGLDLQLNEMLLQIAQKACRAFFLPKRRISIAPKDLMTSMQEVRGLTCSR